MEEKIKILYVEHNEYDIRNFEREIEKSSLHSDLHTVAAVAKAIEATKQKSFDIIFIDYHLKGENGLTLLKSLRNEGVMVPVVVVTNYADPQVAVEMMQSGASDYIPKSLLNADGIEQCIRNSLRFSELEKERRHVESSLKSAEDRLSTVVSFSPLILFTINKNGEFTLAKGRSLGSILPMSEDLIGESIFELFEGKEEFTNQIKIALAGNEVTQAIRFGNEVYQITCTPRSNELGEVIEVIGIANDITKRAEAEESLVKAKLLAEQTSKAKQDFIANMSHEIRTPMNAIVGFTGLLEETRLNEVQRDYVNTIKISGENLLTLINDILDFSKIEAGKLIIEKENFILSNILNSIERVLKGIAIEKNLLFSIHVAPDVPDAMVGDANRLYQVLMNLVGNAIKFTDKGFVKIEVFKSWEKEDRFRLKFLISDSGIGIPKDKHDYVFESFSQVSSGATRKFGGTGLGLAIVKRLVELQKGTVKVNSKLDVGSVFEFEIKYRLSGKIESSKKEEEEGRVDVFLLKGKNILLAEDNRMNQKYIENIFKDTGVNLVIASDGGEALEMLGGKDFDLLLLDIQMPVKDGFEVITEIRKDFPPSKKYIPVIAMTAHAFKEERDACIAAGMNEHIAKPINKEILIRTIYKLLFGKSIEMPESGQMLDISYLKTMSDGNDTFVKEMLTIFVEDTPPLLSSLKAAVETEDWKKISQYAHKYRSPLALLGIKEIETLMKSIEYDAKEQININGINEMFIKSELLSQRVLDEINWKLKDLK